MSVAVHETTGRAFVLVLVDLGTRHFFGGV
jgi:hypothetical protein